MVSSSPAGPPDDRDPAESDSAASQPAAAERVELSKRPADPAAGLDSLAPPADDPPIWAIGPAAAPGAAVAAGVPVEAVPYDAPPPDWIPIVDETRYRATGRDIAMEVVAAVLVAIALTALGAGLAYLWATISPRVVLEMTADGPAYVQPNPEGYVAGESVYLMMTVVVGILSAVAVWILVNNRRGPIVLVGLAVGSIAGAVLMAWLGQRIGLSEYQRLLNEAPVGTRFEVPVKVRSAIIDLPGFKIQGAVLVQAMLAVAVYTLLAGFYQTVSLRPERSIVRFVPPTDGMPQPPLDAQPPAPEADGTVSSDWPEQSDPRAAQAPPAGG